MLGYSNEPAKLHEFAQDAVAKFGYSSESNVSLLNISENATFKVTDSESGTDTILRIHRPFYHTAQAIQSELDWVQALREVQLVRTPAILPAGSGEQIILAQDSTGEERHAVMFEFMPGVEPTEDRLVDDFKTLGAITARLHDQSKQWQRPSNFFRFTWDFETALGPNGHWGSWRDGLAMGPSELEILGRLSDTLGSRLERYGKSKDRFGLVHADMRLANLLVADKDVTVIDFDDCGFSWFMYDLGSSVSFIEDHTLIPDMTASWVDGYRSVAELSKEEEAELPTFIMFRRLLLVAWVGSHQDTDTGKEMGANFTKVSCELAENYLSKFA
ncbi:MAG: phosphotransferase [Candidatus Nanopelagicales bacterium]|nr:phosphotransferase [Candidatus Nanopelagicales bacterium]